MYVFRSKRILRSIKLYNGLSLRLGNFSFFYFFITTSLGSDPNDEITRQKRFVNNRQRQWEQTHSSLFIPKRFTRKINMPVKLLVNRLCIRNLIKLDVWVVILSTFIMRCVQIYIYMYVYVCPSR